MAEMSLLLMLVALVQDGSGVEPAGTVVVIQGSATVGISPSTEAASSLDPLAGGSTFVTADSSAALLSLASDGFVYLGESTTVEILSEDEEGTLRLAEGEIRLTGKDEIVLNPLADARVLDGTLRVKVVDGAATFWSERGSAGIRGANGETLILEAGNQVTYIKGQGFQTVQPATPADWQLEPDALALSVADSVSRQRTDSTTRTTTSDAPLPPTDSADGTSSTDQDSTATNTQSTGLSGINLSLGTSFLSSATGSAGGAFTDANQDSLSGKLMPSFGDLSAGSAFPGTIHLITGQTSYSFDDVALIPADAFPATTQFWSIGDGALPTGQVVTNFLTGTRVDPKPIRIPQFNNYIIHLDQFHAIDSANPATAQSTGVGISGLIGEKPISPDIRGATPHKDQRAQINKLATFALGEFSVRQEDGNPVLSMRRSDQDRRIIKDSNGNDDKDMITANPDVRMFVQAPDPRFLPQNPAVFVPSRGPDALRNLPRYRNEKLLRQAAFTVLTAHQLT